MINIINKAWNWKGFTATQIIQTNEFGNIIFKTSKDEYWRICPEELSCEKIAASDLEWNKLLNNAEFLEDWNMANLVQAAKSELGELNKNQKYCLKMPSLLGGKYEASNLGEISFFELIGFSGDLVFQIKNIKDGEQIELIIAE